MALPKKILIATFSLYAHGKRTGINGMIEPLLSYFLPGSSFVCLIDGPHPGSSTVLTSYEIYEKSVLKTKRTSLVSKLLQPILRLQNVINTQTSFKIRDFFAVFEACIVTKKQYDLFIGLESVYTLAAILLKQLRLIKTVVYLVSDYSPRRYKSSFFNNIYLSLDRFCCYHADYIWDVSPAMQPARIKAGLNTKKSAPVILVRNALFPNQISYLPSIKLEPFSLVFAGTLGPENGPQVAIEAMKIVLKKIPKATLHIIGGNDPHEEKLKALVKENHLGKNVFFHGFISNQITVSNLLKKFMVGLAPYTAIPGSPRWYADATKIRSYLGMGLPVITTHVPPLGKEVEKAGAAMIVKDTKEELADSVIKLLLNKTLYQKMRKSAIIYAKNNTWNNTYSDALKQMQIL